ncbi:Ribosomal large subunit pseudouridine synthase D [Symmachiella macrocystis]|uniref:Ribosomal large subunit pseudouridine synthase D n=1 Tax=Symmachiella macrocystis TaxID=2527985 RepID=A0A5C6B422_9PLAN|nr:RluA family pseudouridine synthase [Symmachiella macrocystis]TWU05234.1 Ribosomal large subunit pseudouridine synthase D [Symmachiella macrocystis]
MTASHTVEHPVELLTFVFACHQDVKKNKVRQWLKYGSVKVNGRSVTRYNHRLQAGDVVSIRGKEEVLSESLLPRGMTVLFEDASLVVIEKPANLLSMANATERNKTAYSYLTDYVRRGNPKSPNRVWIVHRLDRDTSGLMIFAKSEDAKQVLQANWLRAEKCYLAVVEGDLPADSGELSSNSNQRGPTAVDSVPPSERTRLAVTNYRVLKRSATCALVELTPQTGRRNQIREHLADAKCPIIGDRKHKARTNPARRLGLHASSLQFPHPLSGEILNFTSPLPRVLSRQV